MKLCNKYNIPQETMDKMVRDGVISSSWPMYEEVYTLFQRMLSSGKPKTTIYYEIADQKRISEATVKYIVLKMSKI